MLIVPTGDLVGILSDVLPLAPDNKDHPHHGVLLEWDGSQLSAHASDGLSAGVSSYDPDDPDDFPEDGPVVHWGPTEGGEPTWRFFVTAPDAKEIVKTFKLAWKFRAIPLNVKVSPTGTLLFIERTRDTGKTEHTMAVRPPTDGVPRGFPDVPALVADLMHYRAPADHSVVWGHRLAAFQTASRRGPVAQVFTRGDRPTVIKVGNRFIGCVTAEREPKRPASDVLRTGSGVLLGAAVTRQGNGTVMVENGTTS
jgi:hypothetical protein